MRFTKPAKVTTSDLANAWPLLAWSARRFLLRAVVLLLVLLSLSGQPKRLVVVGPKRNVETRNSKIGVHTRLTDEVEEWKIQRTLQMVREMGSPWIVEYFPWGYYEPAKGRYDWAHPDMVIDHAVAQGLTVIARIDFVPQWARPDETTFRYLDRDHFADYADFIYAFVKRYRGKVQQIIIWNEPPARPRGLYRAPLSGLRPGQGGRSPSAGTGGGACTYPRPPRERMGHGRPGLSRAYVRCGGRRLF